MAINKTVMEVGIFNPDMSPARFTLSIFGIDKRHFNTLPSGGNEIMEALLEQRCHRPGPDKNVSLQELGYSTSMFMTRKLDDKELQP